jgi:ABC-type glycerol-3-phosphate transport system substrate-binding protein
VYASQWKRGVVAAAEQGKTSFTDPAIVNALTFMAASLKDGVYNDDPFSTTAFPDAYINQFGSGKAAMVMGGSWFFNVALATPGAVDDWRAFLYPHITGAPRSNWLGSRASGVPVDTGPSPSRPWQTVNLAYAIPKSATGDRAKAAWSFVSFQASQRGQQLNAGWISPSRSDVSLHRVNAGFTKMVNWQQSLFGEAERRDFLYSEVQDALQNAIADVCVNGTDPRAALARVDDVAKQARARDKH